MIGLAATVVLGLAEGDGLRHFGFSYLVNFAFFLSISLGALVFLPIQYVTQASWSVVVRRLAEVMAAVLPLLALLAIPVIVFAGQIYGWASPRPRPTPAAGPQGGLPEPALLRAALGDLLRDLDRLACSFWRSSLAAGRERRPGITRRLENLSGFACWSAR